MNRKQQTWRPALEALETREVPSVTVTGGELVIQGEGLRTDVTVSPIRVSGVWKYCVAEKITTSYVLGLPIVDTRSTYFPMNAVTKKTVRFIGTDGDDKFSISPMAAGQMLRVVANGMAGKDELNGGSREDWLVGGAGDDTLWGNAGSDTLWGGGDNDTLKGGPHVDYLFGGAGVDRLEGDAGNDWLYGGSGADTLDGGTNNDYLIGGGPDEILFGSITHPYLVGAADQAMDIFYGGPGWDTFYRESKWDSRFPDWWDMIPYVGDRKESIIPV